MGKKVAKKYIRDHSETGYTLTAYSSSNYQALEEFVEEVREDFPEKVSSVKEEFDFATILSMDKSTIEEISDLASSYNLDTTGL